MQQRPWLAPFPHLASGASLTIFFSMTLWNDICWWCTRLLYHDNALGCVLPNASPGHPSLKPQAWSLPTPACKSHVKVTFFGVCRRAGKTNYFAASPGPRCNSCKILTCISNTQINCDFLAEMKMITITVDIMRLWWRTNSDTLS